MNEFENMKFRKPRTEEQLKKVTAVRTGMPHKPHKKHVWKQGHSEETKQRISEALRGRQVSVTTREKLSTARKGKSLPEQTKQRISAARKQGCWNKKNQSGIDAPSIL